MTTVKGLLALRFFIGILGGSFVPCQVWSTGFFDKNVVGSANAFTGGIGNAGGGITYFLMPAIFDSLVHDQHLSEHVAWRVSFIVPFIVITATAIAMIICCPDTPTGKWSERHIHAQQSLASHGITGTVVPAQGEFTDQKVASPRSASPSRNSINEKIESNATRKSTASDDHEAPISEQAMMETARGEVVVKPSVKQALAVVLSPQTLVMGGCYFCSFGAELAINSILGAYYFNNFPALGQTGSGRWAAMFGLLNLAFRPAGGVIADAIYSRSNVWGKKVFIHALGLITGAFLIAIGVTDSHSKSTMFGLIAGMAFFLEAGNGANFALVPHVHPHGNGEAIPAPAFFLGFPGQNHVLWNQNKHHHFSRIMLTDALVLPTAGIISGVTGASGNLGGIVFAIIFRYNGKQYGKVVWIIGVMTIAINLAVCWIRPIPKGQIGGR